MAPVSATTHGRRVMDNLRGRLVRPDAALIAVLLAAAIAIAWFGDGLLVAIGLALALAIGGFGSVLVIGPARPGLGLARYVTLPLAAVAMILAGRLLPGGLLFLLVPLAAVISWSVLWLEVNVAERRAAQTALDIVAVLVVTGTTAGIFALLSPDAWPPPLALISLLAAVLGLRLAEGRGEGGLRSVGHALLHALVVSQVGAAVLLLELSGVIAPALIGLAFYVWAGTMEAVRRGAARGSLLIEFGGLALLGLVWALLLYQR